MKQDNNNKRRSKSKRYKPKANRHRLIDSEIYKNYDEHNFLHSNGLIDNFVENKPQKQSPIMSKIKMIMFGSETIDKPYDKVVGRDNKGKKVFPAGTIFSVIKFKRSKETGSLISFVSTNPVTMQVRGVDENCRHPKSLVVAHQSITYNIIPDKLYRVAMVPMFEKQGYVVIDAELYTYKAKVEVEYSPRSKYLVRVKFGNRKIEFDPLNGEKLWSRTMLGCKNKILKHIEIRNISEAIDEFMTAANHVIILMRRDGIHYKESEVTKKKKESGNKSPRSRMVS